MVELKIHPPESIATLWWVVAGVLLALAIIVPLIMWWADRRPKGFTPDQSLSELADSTIAQLAELEERHRAGQIDDSRAAEEISRLVRRFVGLATDHSADFDTATQLRLAAAVDARLEPTAKLVAQLQPIAFGGATGDLAVLNERARKVVAAWS